MRIKRFVPFFIVLSIVAIQLFAETAKAEPPCTCPFEHKPKMMRKLWVMDTCSSELCYYTHIAKGWHAPKEQPNKADIRQVYYLADHSGNQKMLSVVSIIPTDREKDDFKERVKQKCQAAVARTGQDKDACVAANTEELRQTIYAVCDTNVKGCDKLECLGQCYEPYPEDMYQSKPPARKAKK